MNQRWQKVCDLNDIAPNTGVCAEVSGKQLAIFYIQPENRLHSIDNYDPIADANILSRGILGESDGRRVVYSPLYKHPFCLESGVCIEDESIQVPVYAVRQKKHWVEVRLTAPSTLIA